MEKDIHSPPAKRGKMELTIEELEQQINALKCDNVKLANEHKSWKDQNTRSIAIEKISKIFTTTLSKEFGVELNIKDSNGRELSKVLLVGRPRKLF